MNDNIISGLRNMLEDIEKLGAGPLTVDTLLLRQVIDALKTPDEPDPALLVSMAMRVNHRFGLYDERPQQALLNDMRKAWEEVVGKGYYTLANRGIYLAQLAAKEVEGE